MKKFYASTNKVPSWCRYYITPNRKYPMSNIEEDTGNGFGIGFYFTNDEGRSNYALQHGCAHLGGGSWTITEESEGE